ncbi:MAG: hypothetical protein PHS47_01525 [Methanocellales archaeon]|nr:hypothetical protein [Methanocellales archaeon]MDD4898676.1 hypothetical protein [Methanocellales archaeon]MDD5446947.1 hypothetical protein [Methanocellales archaeon]
MARSNTELLCVGLDKKMAKVDANIEFDEKRIKLFLDEAEYGPIPNQKNGPIKI